MIPINTNCHMPFLYSCLRRNDGKRGEAAMNGPFEFPPAPQCSQILYFEYNMHISIDL